MSCGFTAGDGCHRFPIPREQFIEPVDLVVVYAFENVSEVGLRIEAVQLGGFDNGHCAGVSFRAGISPLEEPIFPSNSNRAPGALGWVVADCDTPVCQEQAEGLLPTEAISGGLGQITFAWNVQ